MDDTGATWGIVLAGGSGTRLSPLTTDAGGTVIPKQFCSLAGGPSLLRSTISRLERLVDASRIVVVVSAAHRRWWEHDLAGLPPANIIVQPCNRGTACGLLLPLTTVLHRDPEAQLLVSPCDHHVSDPDALEWSLMEALAHVSERPRLLVLMGIEPDHADTSYGWIIADEAGEDPLRRVVSFVEKPDLLRARELLATGALWSSLILVATGDALLALFQRALPRLVESFDLVLAGQACDPPPERLSSLYDRLPTVDFSESVLQSAAGSLHVLAVPPCGWTDLGTPQRVAECLEKGNCPFPAPPCTDAPPPSPTADWGDGPPSLDLALAAARRRASGDPRRGPVRRTPDRALQP